MNEIHQETIDKYTRFLTVVKKSEGKELDLKKVIESFRLNTSSAYYARYLNFFDFEGNKILKARYDLNEFDKVDPIHARRFVEGMYRLIKENKGLPKGRKSFNKTDMEKPVVMEAPLKTCTKCKADLPATTDYFNKDRSKSDGLQCACKKCRSLMSSKSKPIMEIPVKEPAWEDAKVVTSRHIKTDKGIIAALKEWDDKYDFKTGEILEERIPEPKPTNKEKKGYVIRIFGLPLFGVERW